MKLIATLIFCGILCSCSTTATHYFMSARSDALTFERAPRTVATRALWITRREKFFLFGLIPRKSSVDIASILKLKSDQRCYRLQVESSQSVLDDIFGIITLQMYVPRTTKISCDLPTGVIADQTARDFSRCFKPFQNLSCYWSLQPIYDEYGETHCCPNIQDNWDEFPKPVPRGIEG